MSIDPNREWEPRLQELLTSKHLRAQAKRAHKVYKIIHGTEDAVPFKQFLNDVAQLVALSEVTGIETTACVGGVTIQRGPMEGYSIHLWAADVFVDHIHDLSHDPKSLWDRAQELWRRKPPKIRAHEARQED